MAVWGGIEAGGTKFVCAVGSGPNHVRAETRYATRGPGEDIPRAIEFFRAQQVSGPLEAVGIASFGPLDPDPASPTYGYVTTTPKPGWAHTDFAGAIGRALGVPVGFDTDVNVAALGEGRWGAGRGLDTFIYLTIGTGIGGGGLVRGEMLHGLVHPEMGHVRVPHDTEADPYPGNCLYHRDCLEGLACGPAMEARWGQPAESLPADHPGWDLEAEYLAYGLVAYVAVLSPRRIIMGGGVMSQRHLFPSVRRKFQELQNGYIQSPALLDGIDDYIVPPTLGDHAGVLGAIALAQEAAGRAVD